jgi:signal peptidase I
MTASRIAEAVVIRTLCACLLAIGALYLCGYRIYRVPTVEMQPTIRKGERVVARLSGDYRNDIQRFDLVLFTTPGLPGQIVLKRVVGLPGERITIGATGVRINDRRIVLPGSASTAGLESRGCDIRIPADSIFVLGDITSNSFDSRSFGPIPRDAVLGYLVYRK